ncbi:conserved Plasmodium protein, unknown function [Plasmodium gallinaceum]|uniref:Uncharacterized protein n=1 Tax=Plasmodium gallinaceum TaxID=5849 RepID=A0A1J1GYQ7_PLAGA|nr:conserved Plasmodium protein, unknown function [Plasmodium gallinaceum]CRG97447.1 conserved Plasmodium protein, unknown function [Plasmodium gallinaceum]
MRYLEKDESDNRRADFMATDYSFIRKEYKTNYKKVSWPINVEIYDVDDKSLKKDLCLIVTNLPVDWKKCDIIWFFREYFYNLAINENVFFPLIEQVYLIKNESSAILACHDGISKEVIQSLSKCIIKNVKDKKKIVFTIYPYYKRYDVDEKEKEEKEEEKEKDKEKEEEEKGKGKKEKEVYSEDEKYNLKRLRKRSLTYPRKNGLEWPNNIDLRNCNDLELRKKLCVFGRYKPLHWGVRELSEFLKYYFESLKKDIVNFEIPQICDMWADKGTHLVTFACKNEKSRFSMLLIRACYLNEEDAKNNLKNSLRGWLEFEKWTPFKNTINSRYKSHKIGRNEYNKYSSIHDHVIDKNYRRRNYRKPLYEELARNKKNSFRTNMNLSKLSNGSNYYFHKEDRNRKNYDNLRNSYKKISPSPFFKKHKKRYSRSSSKNYYKKKYRKSKSVDSYKNNDYAWSKNRSYNKNFSDSSRKSYRK